MSESDRFEAWWQTLNVYDPTLKALAGSAWMEAIRTTTPPANQCAACDAPAEPGTVGCKDCNEYATAICSPEPQSEQWPKYWTTFNTDTYAFVKQISQDDCQCVFKNGTHGPVVGFNHDQAKDRQPLTEAKAMALLEKPEPQPAKTRVRLWLEGPTTMVMCRDKAPYGDWREIHHDADGFYVEGQR